MSKIENKYLTRSRFGSRQDRKRKKSTHKKKFNIMFDFFLSSYRKGILTFCGSVVDIDFDINSDDGKFVFKSFENGVFKNKKPITKHVNIVRGVIIGKKSWGLFLDQWSDGIVDCTFTQEDIIGEFTMGGIKIPESLMDEWDKLIEKKKRKRNENYLKSLYL
jgi:hypothetical protein